MATPPTGTELDTETFVSWREFLGSSHARSLALVSLAVWLHAADSLIVATQGPGDFPRADHVFNATGGRGEGFCRYGEEVMLMLAGG